MEIDYTNLPTRQLYEKINGEYKPFNPHVTLKDIEELYSSKSVEFILHNYNFFNVDWKDNTENTRAQVPSILRRNGFWLAYNDGINKITERFIGSDKQAFDYDEWIKDENWQRLDFELLLKGVEDVLEAIFKNLDGYPKFKDQLDDLLQRIIAEMLTPEMMSQIIGDNIQELINNALSEMADNYFDSEEFETKIKDICCSGKSSACPHGAAELHITYKAGQYGTGNDFVDTCSDEDEYIVKDNMFNVSDNTKAFDTWIAEDGQAYTPGTKILPTEDIVLTANYRTPVKEWIETSKTECDGYDKYAIEQLYVDGVATSEVRRGRLIEANSSSCGYTPEIEVIDSNNYTLGIKNGITTPVELKITYRPINSDTITPTPALQTTTVIIQPHSRFSTLTRDEQDLDAISNDEYVDVCGFTLNNEMFPEGLDNEHNPVKIELLSGQDCYIEQTSTLDYSGGYVDGFGSKGRYYVRILKPYDEPEPTPGETVEWRRVDGQVICTGTTAYSKLEKYVNGVATGEYKKGDLIEENSTACGYTPKPTQYTHTYSVKNNSSRKINVNIDGTEYTIAAGGIQTITKKDLNASAPAINYNVTSDIDTYFVPNTWVGQGGGITVNEGTEDAFGHRIISLNRGTSQITITGNVYMNITDATGFTKKSLTNYQGTIADGDTKTIGEQTDASFAPDKMASNLAINDKGKGKPTDAENYSDDKLSVSDYSDHSATNVRLAGDNSYEVVFDVNTSTWDENEEHILYFHLGAGAITSSSAAGTTYSPKVEVHFQLV